MEILWIIVLGAGILIGVVLLLIFLLKPKRAEEAIEVHGRRRYDTLTLDQEMDEEVLNRKFMCPECGGEVFYDESECPSCGVRFTKDEFDCPSCGKQVDPREKECPYCGEILLEEPFVCPNCSSPVSPDATRCDRCNISFWSPIRLDERSMDERRRNASLEPQVEPEPVGNTREEGPPVSQERLHPGRSRRYR